MLGEKCKREKLRKKKKKKKKLLITEFFTYELNENTRFDA